LRENGNGTYVAANLDTSTKNYCIRNAGFTNIEGIKIPEEGSENR
jgi:hypothetical protein